MMTRLRRAWVPVDWAPEGVVIEVCRASRKESSRSVAGMSHLFDTLRTAFLYLRSEPLPPRSSPA